MQINTNQTQNNVMLSSTQKTTTQSQGLSASKFMEQVDPEIAGEAKRDYKSRDEINEDDPALQQFKKDLTTKGAAKYLHDFNMQKIEKMVEEYRDKLIKELGENPTAQDLEAVEEKVSNFKKELLERLAEANDKDKNSPTNINRIEFEIINNMRSELQNALKTLSS